MNTLPHFRPRPQRAAFTLVEIMIVVAIIAILAAIAVPSLARARTTGTDGTWYWLYYPNALPGYKGLIYLYNPTLSSDDITFLDQKLDDGNINTGALISYGGQGLIYAAE